MEPSEITTALQDVTGVRRVFGEPYEVDGVTIIPVARVGGGGGGGHGDGGEGEGGGSGVGIGFGARPVGAYVVRDGAVEWVPAYDVAALAGRVAVVAVATLLTWKSVSKARQRRKRAAVRAAMRARR